MSKLKKLEEEKLQALDKVKFAASYIDELFEEKNILIDELKTSKEELQKIEQLDSTLKNTEERYEVMLDEARYEIVCLKKTVEKLEAETNNSSTEWDTKELHLINGIKKSELKMN
ncbi:hypothetical protein Cni_G16749 [Canna indica]|uniref:Uncharacterized protein n=1 Tax=Canna indica TaxID=4628 RepID=A0AAQ3KFP0_9LILI|nr:hypothetical protein Cni_G16749 [Canna indica]